MRSTEPPKVARWLLAHFGSSLNNESVIGDLDERYSHGRSYLWYWRQAVTALIAGFAKEVSGHKRLAIGVLLVGWMSKLAWLSLGSYVDHRLAVNMLLWSGSCCVAPHNGQIFTLTILGILLFLSAAVCAATARLIGVLSGPSCRAMILLYLKFEFLAVPALLLFGWRHSLFFPTISQFANWPSLFATYLSIALYRLGYLNVNITGLWFGSALTAVLVLWGSGAFQVNHDSDHQPPTQAVV